jgi:hypothetical protein
MTGAIIAQYKAIVEEELGKPSRRMCARAALGRDRAVFKSWMNPRAITYRECTTSRRLGHGGQRPGHGVRQYGR